MALRVGSVIGMAKMEKEAAAAAASQSAMLAAPSLASAAAVPRLLFVPTTGFSLTHSFIHIYPSVSFHSFRIWVRGYRWRYSSISFLYSLHSPFPIHSSATIITIRQHFKRVGFPFFLACLVVLPLPSLLAPMRNLLGPPSD